MKIVTIQLRNHIVTRSVLSRCRVAVILQRKNSGDKSRKFRQMLNGYYLLRKIWKQIKTI